VIDRSAKAAGSHREGEEKVATEMALHVLAYNITRVMNIMGVEPLIAAIRV
jgi:hypothetical protein